MAMAELLRRRIVINNKEDDAEAAAAAAGAGAFRATYFDPVTSALEASVLARLGWTLVDDEEGKHQAFTAAADDEAPAGSCTAGLGCSSRAWAWRERG